mgnify:CR=1 FL=1
MDTRGNTVYCLLVATVSIIIMLPLYQYVPLCVDIKQTETQPTIKSLQASEFDNRELSISTRLHDLILERAASPLLKQQRRPAAELTAGMRHGT